MSDNDSQHTYEDDDQTNGSQDDDISTGGGQPIRTGKLRQPKNHSTRSSSPI